MADSFNKKEKEKKRRKKKQEKAERKLQRKLSGDKPEEFMYLDENGNLTPIPPDKTKKREISLDEIRISTPKKEELEDEDPTKRGMVKFFNQEKRFGFISDDVTGHEYFFHEENVLEEVKERDIVEYEIGKGPKGLMAINVKPTKS